MPPRTSRQQYPGHTVTAVVVCHDGAEWLADCLAAVAAQTRTPQRVVAVDTGVDPAVRSMLVESLGESAVVSAPAHTALGAAVDAGLGAFAEPLPADPRTKGGDWVWLLHDDAAPDPRALQELLARAAAAPEPEVVGPKVLDWERHHLLEIGITTDTSGRRQTGLDPREVDQGQHDDVDEVLAVGTAGMLVRRDVWDRLGGLDPTWPLFGDDVDFGWRVTAGGGLVAVAPRAVVRHAAALSAGRRRADAVRGRPGVALRAHGMQVVLANTAAALVPLLFLRFVVEGLLRAVIALVLVRSPGLAVDELLATGQVTRRPMLVLGARRRRAPLRRRPHREIRHLLAGAGLRWRAISDQVAETLSGPRAREERLRRRGVPVETGPVADESESMDVDDAGRLRRALVRPGVLLAAALVVLGLVADRGLLGGTLHGGRLLPAPQGASDLWSLYGAAWHPVGLGSTTATPPWVAVMALLSSVLFGKVWLAVDVVVLGAVPLAGLSAYAAVGRITRAWPVRVWVAVAYAFTPVLTGAVAGGRLDVVAITVLLPLVVRACAAAVAVDQQARGWHRSAGAGLLLAVAASFLPLLWVLVAGAVVVGVLVEALAARVPWPVTARRMLAGAGVLGVAAAALVPWTGTVLVHPRLLVSGLGLPETFARRHPQQVADLLLLHPGGAGQPPLWVAAPVVLAALVGLGRAHHRAAARAGFVMVAVGLTAALVESRLSGVTAGIPASRYWTGGALAFAVVGALVAAAVAADGARTALARHAFGWRQPAAVLVAAAAVAGSVAAAVSWVGRAAEGPLTDRSSQLLPLFAAAEVTLPTSPRVLALRADGDLVRYALVRKASGPELGDADVVTLSTSGPARVARRRLADAVRDLAAARPQAVNGLAPFAVAMVATPATVAALAQLPDVDGLSHVPAPGAVIYRTGDAPGELVVRRPGSATGAAVAAAPGAARTTVPAGPTGRLLVLAEPRDRHWRARLDGRSLPATTADGWAQAWRLPAAGGSLVVGRTGDPRSTWLTVQAVVVMLALLLSIPNRRRRRPGTSGEAGP